MKPLRYQTIGRTESDLDWAKRSGSDGDIVYEGIPVCVAILHLWYID